MTTGYLWSEVYGWHDTGMGPLFPADPAIGLQPLPHIANADTKRRIHELVAVSGLLDRLHRVRPRPATREELLRVHTAEHVARIEAESAQPKGGDAGDGFSPFGLGGYEIAALAAGGALAMVEAVVSGTVDNGYALVNPPGHHARPDTGMGFCVFSNAAVAAAHARAALGVGRIAVVDWDVHHGNGTQAAFAADPTVLTVSVHQDRCFPPDSGLLDERGEGAGHGYALNVPLPPGTRDGGYAHAFETVVVPALRAFRPELVIVASGLDPNAMDPLARQMVSSRGFVAMTEQVLGAARELCDGRVVAVQEGGYMPLYVPFCALAVIATMAGEPPPVDPVLPIVTGFAGHELTADQEAVCARAAALVADVEPVPVG